MTIKTDVLFTIAVAAMCSNLKLPCARRLSLPTCLALLTYFLEHVTQTCALALEEGGDLMLMGYSCWLGRPSRR